MRRDAGEAPGVGNAKLGWESSSTSCLYPCANCGKAANPAEDSWCDDCIEDGGCTCGYDSVSDTFDPCERHAPSSRTWPKGAWPGER